MSAENKVGIFGNGPTIELVRDVLSTPLHVFKYEIFGQENLDIIKTSPSILYFFPHSSHLDPFSIRFASPRGIREYEVFPAAKDYWYRNELMTIAHSLVLNTYPMERQNTNGILESMEMSRRFLDAGYSLVIAPEGTRTSLPLEERELHHGASDLALQGGYPIIPIRLKGFEKILPKGHNIPKLLNGLHRDHVSVIFGKQISVPRVGKYSYRRMERQSLTHLLRGKLLEM